MAAGTFLDVEYESVVANLEDEARRIIAYCGLSWDDRCPSFHETERQIMTASVWQVRQPLYASSVGRWRNYRRHLGPLLSGLAGIIPQDVDVPIIPVGPVGDGSDAGRQ